MSNKCSAVSPVEEVTQYLKVCTEREKPSLVEWETRGVHK